MERELLYIEKEERDTLTDLQEKLIVAVDKIGTSDPEKYPLNHEDCFALAQYFSWSFVEGTGHSAEDEGFKPENRALCDVRLCFLMFKAKAEELKPAGEPQRS